MLSVEHCHETFSAEDQKGVYHQTLAAYLFALTTLLTLIAPGTALAQNDDNPPQPPLPEPGATTPAAAGACVTTSSCKDIASCQMQSEADVAAYACLAYRAKLSCIDALKKTPTPLSDEDYYTIREFYWNKNWGSDCWVPHPLQNSWLATSILVGKGYGPVVRHAVQIMPSFSLGIPIAFIGKENDAELALRDVHAIGGLFVRYSPLGLWASVHGFFGTSTITSAKLDPVKYPSPAMVLYGGGIDALGGSVSLSILGASLRPDGLFSRSAETAAILQMGIDLTAIGITVAGLPK
ncbi:hypothetical protein WMF37_42715 [Sorangium sp. So ce291]|uniref:hypothetical protein n=1 Tax=Sorangium sp. So ce291 TaxID=3133294 RepID=UPI003F5DD4BB